MSSFHPFAARPPLPKRHTSPSPSALLALPTLEALPPTPRSAKSYDPLNIHFSSQVSIAETSSSSNRSNTSSRSISTNMPLIKSRSKRPTSPKTENYSFLPSIVSALDPRGNGSRSGSGNNGGKHQRMVSRSHPPQPSTSISRDFDMKSFSPYHSSTPPSTYSKNSLNALPSIQGVFDSYDEHQSPFDDGGFGIKKKNSKKSKKDKKDRRNTLRLPMMIPNANESNQSKKHPFNAQENGDDWYWDRFNQPAQVIITREDDNNNTHQASLPSSSSNHQNNVRKRNTSLTIDTHLNRPCNPREHSFSSQSQNTSHFSLPVQSRSSNRSSPIDPETTEERSTLTSWLGPEDDDLDDVELQALDVLETLSGHLLRDGFGYGTGLSPNLNTPSTSKEGVPSLTRSGNSTPSKSRSRSTTYSTQAPSENDKRHSQLSDKDPPSIREWRESRKRTTSQGYALTSSSGRPVSEQNQLGYTQIHDNHTTFTHTRGSLSMSRRPPPPPPPPESSLPPLPILPIHTNTSLKTQTQTQPHVPQTSTQPNKNNKELIDDANKVTDTGSNSNQENNKHLISVVSGSVPLSGLSKSDQNQINIPSSTQSLPPPIPPRSASRLESHASPRRASSSNQLRQRPPTPAQQRKGSKEKQGVKVPLVFSTTSESYSPAITTREGDEGDLVVVIDNTPPTPAADMPSPTIPVHQRPLPPLPALPDLPTHQSQRSALSRLAHPTLPTRLLRPKRPSTAPSPARPVLPIPTEALKPTIRLIPREEPRRLSSSSRVEGEEGRKHGMSALSFLALDDAAIHNLSSRNSRAASSGGSSGPSNAVGNAGSGHGSGISQARMESPTQGLEGGYIMPPSERSKIGIDDRKEIRRRRRGSQSSLSSIAGSEGTSHVDTTKANLLNNYGEEEEKEEIGVWTTAYEFGQSKARTKERELRLSLDIGLRPSIPTSISLNSPLKGRPAPLNLFSSNDYQNNTGGDEHEGKQYPKSAGLLPPPRPRRKTTPSAPPLIFTTHSHSQNPQQPNSPISPRNRKGFGQISPIYTHRSIGSHPAICTESNSLSRSKGDNHQSSRNIEEDRDDNDGLKDFMELNSPVLPISPNLTTPGQSYIFPPSNIHDHHDDHQEKERKASGSTIKSTSISDSNSSNWSNDTYEKERKMITSLWLSSKPTRSGSKQGQGQSSQTDGAQNESPQHHQQLRHQHPFYSIGAKSDQGQNQFNVNNGNGKSIVVDGGYGRRGSFGIKI